MYVYPDPVQNISMFFILKFFNPMMGLKILIILMTMPNENDNNDSNHYHNNNKPIIGLTKTSE